MANIKIQDERQVIAWLEEGHTYQAVANLHLEKYGVKVGKTAIAEFAKRHDLNPRQVINRDLIPWKIKLEHQYEQDARMLRQLARRLAGRTVSQADELDRWESRLKAENKVVAYDPNKGWSHVERRDGDAEYIRPPDARLPHGKPWIVTTRYPNPA
ncbi:hypothetical protein [Salininema proteolyticum]|uniref:Transposase n=1 Tax=Salininema proteolyticum TaxID=1607685 RepID=A0ABV8U028_9ACTN